MRSRLLGNGLLDGDLLGLVVIVATIGASVVLMTLPFVGKQWMLGDLAYHRGVTLSLDLAHPFGEGPIAGVMSYYGGLYHLLLAGLSRLFNLTFEQSVGVLSLVWSVVWPVSLIVLGRRLWPGNLPAVAVFAAAGTLVMPLTTDFADELWVESVLPSGMAFWPAYPRDLAMSFGVLALAFALDPRTIRRRIGTGVFLGLAITTHPQIAADVGQRRGGLGCLLLYPRRPTNTRHRRCYRGRPRGVPFGMVVGAPGGAAARPARRSLPTRRIDSRSGCPRRTSSSSCRGSASWQSRASSASSCAAVHPAATPS